MKDSAAATVLPEWDLRREPTVSYYPFIKLPGQFRLIGDPDPVVETHHAPKDWQHEWGSEWNNEWRILA